MCSRIIKLLFVTSLATLLAACSPAPAPGSRPALNSANTKVLPWDNVWVAMRHNFDLPTDVDEPAVQAQIRWYVHNRRYLEHILSNSRPYISYMYQQTQLRHLPAELALLPLIESSYKPYAYSSAGAVGLWQLMPGTASGFGLKIDWWYDGRRSVTASTRAALTYLTYLHAFFDDHWLQAIAAYNSGEGTVQNAIRYNQHHHQPTDFWSLLLPQETKIYVPKLLALAAIVEDPNKYHITLPRINKDADLEVVDIHSQLDLALAAKLADMKLRSLRILNPGDLRWATDPSGPNTLLLPKDRVALFDAHLAALPQQNRVTWWHYRVRSGDTLDRIARRYHTTTLVLKHVNHLTSNMLHIGQGLLIPQNVQTSNQLHNRGSIETLPRHIPGPQRLVYQVQPGDSLWHIASTHGVTEREILFWNKGLSRKYLKPGEDILIWMPSHHRPIFHHVTHAVHYRVRPGDSLDHIASRFHTSAQSLRQLNRLPNNTIHAGEILNVGHTVIRPRQAHTAHRNNPNSGWIHYTIKPGDTLDKIARQYHTSAHAIERWNALKGSDMLKPGEQLAIYVM